MATVEDAVEFWRKRKEKDGPIGRTSWYFANKFAEALGDQDVMDLTGADLATYIDRGQGAPAQRREINTIKSIVNYFRKMSGDQPIYMDRPRDNAGRTQWLTAEQRDQFIELAPDEIKPLVTAMFFTGARRGELACARVADVDWAKRTLELAHRKGGMGLQRRKVPIHDRVWPYVQQARDEGRRLLFPDPDGNEWKDRAFSRPWWQTVVACGLTDLKPHDARHTFATLLVKQGVSLRVIADLLGHSGLTMVLRYAHMASEAGDEAVHNLK